MATSYEDAVMELYQAPHEAFVSERKRLAGELKRAGMMSEAARLAKLGRPNLSAWVVNQLWWKHRKPFELLFETAERLREGELSATSAHRDALSKLRSRAATMLEEAGHGSTDPTMRRVTTTLSALAPAGGFAPDAAGALSADRESPGFEAAGVLAGLSSLPGPKPAATKATATKKSSTKVVDEARKREEAALQRKRAADERAHRMAERRRIEALLRSATAKLKERARDVERAQTELASAEKAREKAQTVLDELEAELAKLQVR